MITVGIIGTGFGAKIHLPGFENVPEVKVMGIYGREFNKTKKIAEAYNVPMVFKRWEDLVRSKQIKAVSIAVPPYLHAKIALAAIKNKKAVLSEKPLSCSITEAKQMLMLTKKHRTIHAIDFECRYTPAFKILKKMLTKKIVGHLRSINIAWTSGGRASNDIPIGWSNYKKYGGGVLLNYTSHEIDYIEWLFGPIKWVSGRLFTTKQFSKKNKFKPNTDDLVTAQFQLTDGTPCNLLITNVVFSGQGQQLDIYGDKGTITLHNCNVHDFSRNFKLSVSYPNGVTKNVKIPKLANDKQNTDSRLAPFTALAADFVKGIKKNKLIAPSFIEGYRTQQIITAIQNSSQKKRWIKI